MPDNYVPGPPSFYGREAQRVYNAQRIAAGGIPQPFVSGSPIADRLEAMIEAARYNNAQLMRRPPQSAPSPQHRATPRSSSTTSSSTTRLSSVPNTSSHTSGSSKQVASKPSRLQELERKRGELFDRIRENETGVTNAANRAFDSKRRADYEEAAERKEEQAELYRQLKLVCQEGEQFARQSGWSADANSFHAEAVRSERLEDLTCSLAGYARESGRHGKR